MFFFNISRVCVWCFHKKGVIFIYPTLLKFLELNDPNIFHLSFFAQFYIPRVLVSIIEDVVSDKSNVSTHN